MPVEGGFIRADFGRVVFRVTNSPEPTVMGMMRMMVLERVGEGTDCSEHRFPSLRQASLGSGLSPHQWTKADPLGAG